MRFKVRTLGLLFSTFASLYAQNGVDDISLEDMLELETELTADVGSRSGAVSSLFSISPTDVITAKEIEESAESSLTNLLRHFVAGFNAPETSVADGSDHVRVFTLRGMSPDQTLVLINGKRVHTSALLHVNGTIGRGSSGVDLDTIALSSIEKIEILRDGAAAQYGSDAISGVINIILKGAEQDNRVSFQSGVRKKGDGRLVNTELFLSKELEYDGFVNFTLEVKDQEQTQRAGEDRRELAPIYKTHVGIPDSKNIVALLNSDIELKNSANIYTNATFNYRKSEASTFARERSESYPDGFLPILQARILDSAFTVGTKGEFRGGFYWDISNTLGYNSIRYTMEDTYNYDLNPSPSSFYNGELSFLQNTTNIDVKKRLGSLDIAFGAEHRYEDYKIDAGDEASYYASGSQGFSGYREENEVDASRYSNALYFDMKYKATKRLLAQGAIRYEKFSDFEATTTAKLALSYRVNSSFLLRSSTSSGFRAPSLSQSHYSHTSSFNGLIEGTYKPSDEVAQLFGAKKLKAEKSKHFTAGVVYQLSEESSLMVDYFYTAIKDRIILSNEYTLTPDQQEIYDINKARFFTNAVDTVTDGVDVKYNYLYKFEKEREFGLTLWYNYSKNSVVSFNDESTSRENSYEQIDRMENGQPKTMLKALLSYRYDKVKTTFNTSYIGAYREVIDNVAYDFDAEIYNDLDIEYSVRKNLKIAIGSLNMFNTLPNKWDGLDGYTYGEDGIKPYSRYSPYGYSGAYYYLRANYRF
jgi:iron complex outermembrane receptor protein